MELAEKPELAGRARDAGRSLAAEMTRAYRRPRRTMERALAAGVSEGRALFHLLAGCLLLCAASIPEAIRTSAGLAVEDATNAVIAARIFGFMVLLPIFCFGIATLFRLVAQVSGGIGDGLAVRSAVFWSILLGGPIALLLSAISAAGVTAEGMSSNWMALFGLGYWLWLASASLGAAERLRTPAIMAGLGFSYLAVALATKLLI